MTEKQQQACVFGDRHLNEADKNHVGLPREPEIHIYQLADIIFKQFERLGRGFHERAS